MKVSIGTLNHHFSNECNNAIGECHKCNIFLRRFQLKKHVSLCVHNSWMCKRCGICIPDDQEDDIEVHIIDCSMEEREFNNEYQDPYIIVNKKDTKQKRIKSPKPLGRFEIELLLSNNKDLIKVYNKFSYNRKQTFDRFLKINLITFLDKHLTKNYDKNSQHILHTCLDSCLPEKHKKKLFKHLECKFCDENDTDVYGCQELGCDNFCQFICTNCHLYFKLNIIKSNI